MDIDEIIQKGKQAGISKDRTLQILQKNGVDVSSYVNSSNSQSSLSSDISTTPTSHERTKLGKFIQSIAQVVAEPAGFALNQLYGATQVVEALLGGEEAQKKYLKEGLTGLNLGYFGDMGKPMEMRSIDSKEGFADLKKSVGIGWDAALNYLPGGALAKAGEVAGGKAAASLLSNAGRKVVSKIPVIGEKALASDNLLMKGAKTFIKHGITGAQFGAGYGLSQGLQDDENVIGILGDILHGMASGFTTGGVLGTGLSAGGTVARSIQKDGLKKTLENTIDTVLPSNITTPPPGGAGGGSSGGGSLGIAKDLGVDTSEKAINYLENASKYLGEFNYDKVYTSLKTAGNRFNELVYKDSKLPDKYYRMGQKFEEESGISLGDSLIADMYGENPVTWKVDKYGRNKIDVENYAKNTSKMNEALLKQLENFKGQSSLDDMAKAAEALLDETPTTAKRNKEQLRQQIADYKEKYGDNLDARTLKEELTKQWNEAYTQSGTVSKEVNNALGKVFKESLISLTKDIIPIENQLKVLQSRQVYGPILKKLNGAKAVSNFTGKTLAKATQVIGSLYGSLGSAAARRVANVIEDKFLDPNLRISKSIKEAAKVGKITHPVSTENFVNDTRTRIKKTLEDNPEITTRAIEEIKTTGRVSPETIKPIQEAIEASTPQPKKIKLSENAIEGISHKGLADEIKSLGGDVNAIAEWLNGLGLSEELIQKYSPSLAKMKTLASIRSIIDRIKAELSNVSNVIE